MFLDGEYLDYTFATEPEPLSVIAQVVVQDDTIEFRDVAIYCGEGNRRIPLGVSVLRRILREVGELVRSSGYNRIIITGDRHTGANPNRDVRITRKLQ